MPDDLLSDLDGVPVDRQVFEDRDIIVPAGPAPDRSCLLIRGAALRSHRHGQETAISALCLAGDFIDLHAIPLRVLDHDMVSVGRSVVEFVDHPMLLRHIEARPEIGLAFWCETLVDAKIHRAWVVAAARLQAPQRIAHLLCEMERKLARVGLSDGGHFVSPLDQKRVAEVLGLSLVHTNRAVQDLRASGMLVWKGRSIHLTDIPAIRAFAQFDPDYLDA